jgi:hypothetical protein
MSKKRRVPLLRKKRKSKHDTLVNDYENQKNKHLERLASKSLEEQEKLSKLRDKNIDKGFLDLF